MSLSVKNAPLTLGSRYLPLAFPLLVYVFWFVSQGPTEALRNFLAEVGIAITMVFGSFVAGGTALGGGAVAFPVMTKALGVSPATAKIFSLAIQSFGMTAAALAIIFAKIPYYRRAAVLAIVGALPGVLLSLVFIADLFPRLLTKSVFSLLLLFFGVTLFRMYGHGERYNGEWSKLYLLPVVGFFGGVASGLIGSGADIMVFALLVLYYKKDLKMATATSVVIMAVTSVVGSLCNLWYLAVFDNQIKSYVLAAVPVVVIGAPLGAYVCSRVRPAVVLWFLLLLIGLEVGSTSLEWMYFFEQYNVTAKLLFFR